jgi:hypothetical protein
MRRGGEMRGNARRGKKDTNPKGTSITELCGGRIPTRLIRWLRLYVLWKNVMLECMGIYEALSFTVEGQRNQPSWSNFPKFGLDMK